MVAARQSGIMKEAKCEWHQAVGALGVVLAGVARVSPIR